MSWIAAILAAFALAAAGNVALAQTDKKDSMTKKEIATKRSDNREEWEKQFKATDKNGDGALTMDELKNSKYFGQIKQHFGAIDANHDGKVTIAEHDAWHSAQVQARKSTKAAAGGTK